MAKLYNLARMTTATTGTGSITLGSAVSGYLTFAQAGVANSDVVDYAIKDGSNSEHGCGVYSSSGTTLTRNVVNSTNSNAAISLSGAAEVFISPLATTIQQVPAGQCKLIYNTTSVVTLVPRGGNLLRISGENWPIPAVGVSLSGTGLTDGVVYYVYAYMNAGTMTLEASTTGRGTDNTPGNIGVEIKLFDNSRTLVGMVLKASGSFFDTTSIRYVRSWFNEDGVSCFTQSSSPATISSTASTYFEIDTAARCWALLWAGERYLQILSCVGNNSTAISAVDIICMPDGVATGQAGRWQPSVTGGYNATLMAQFGTTVPVDNVHYFAMGGAVFSGNTAGWSLRSNSISTRRS